MKWISVKDSLPKQIGDYLIYDSEVIAWSFFNSDKKWAGYNGHNCFFDATHWMPLPEPPKILTEPID
ncbi:MAG: DUF551 domain-containing protein [bacterium]|nr:DUF551 domain-containing protein [bacterium]